MRKTNLLQRVILPVMISVLFFLPPACSESVGPDTLMKGVFSDPVSITVSAPVYHIIARFGEDRTEVLNRLLKHISISITFDGTNSETAVMVDRETAYSYIQYRNDSTQLTVYSFDPEITYEESNEYFLSSHSFPAFLDEHFFLINRLLDDFYPIFQKTAETFAEYGKPSSASLNFKGYGKGVRKLTIPLSDQFVKEKFPAVIADLAETEESRMFLEKLVFNGPQKIILLYDQEDRLLRMNYDGTVGFSEESMRKVSLVWRCLRSDEKKKDNITLKTPAVKGYDKYNISYERDIDLSDPAHHTISWDMQIDLKSDKTKKKISFTSDLSGSDNVISGRILYSEKAEGNEKKITILPMMQKENDGHYYGTIEITNNSGKIITSSAVTEISISPGTAVTAPSAVTAHSKDGQNPETDTESIQDKMNSILIRKLLTLPAEDLQFFSMDIPEEDWEAILQSMF